MPIKGMTDRPEEFPCIGWIRKGEPKRKETRNGREIELMGRDLDHFRFEFAAGEEAAMTQLALAYPTPPRDVFVLLPFNAPDENFECFNEAYISGALIARDDGERMLYRINPETGQVLVRNGLDVATGQPAYLANPPAPVYTYTQNNGKQVEVFTRPTGRLKVMVQPMRRLAYMMLTTRSKHDVMNLSKQLRALHKINGGRLVGVPLILRRRERQISTPDASQGGKKVRRGKWLCSIEADPEWVRQKVEALLAEGRPQLPAGELLVLAEPGTAIPGLQQPVPQGSLVVGTGTGADYFDDAVPEDEAEWEEIPAADAPEPARAPANAVVETAKPMHPPAPAPAKPAPAPAKGRVVGFIRDPKAWAALLKWAIEQGFYAESEKAAPMRMESVLKKKLEYFDATQVEAARAALAEHYASKR